MINLSVVRAQQLKRETSSAVAIATFFLSLTFITIFDQPGTAGNPNSTHIDVAAFVALSIVLAIVDFAAFMYGTAGGRLGLRLVALPVLWTIMLTVTYYADHLHSMVLFNVSYCCMIFLMPAVAVYLLWKLGLRPYYPK